MVALALLGGTGLIVYAAALLLVPSDGEVAAGPTDTARPRARRRPARSRSTIVGFVVRRLRPRLRRRARPARLPRARRPRRLVARLRRAPGRQRRRRRAPRRARRRAADRLLRARRSAASSPAASAAASSSRRSSSPPARRSSRRRSSAARAGSCCRRWRSRCRWRSCRRPTSTSTAASASATCAPARSPRSRTSYRLGAGELVVDLRDVKLPAGDHRLKVGIGAGHALVLVPDDVCVASKATVGMGGVVGLRPRRRRHRRRLERRRGARPPARRGSSSTATSGSGCSRCATRDGHDHDGLRRGAHRRRDADERNAPARRGRARQRCVERLAPTACR